MFAIYALNNMRRRGTFPGTRNYGTFFKHERNYNSTPKYKGIVYRYWKCSATFKHFQKHRYSLSETYITYNSWNDNLVYTTYWVLHLYRNVVKMVKEKV